MKQLALSLGLALSLTATAETPLEAAKAAFERGDAAEAVRIYSALAADGNAKAQYNLAYCYQEGLGIAADRSKARTLLQQAAAQHLPEAEYRLGLLLLYGTDGVITYEAPAMQSYNTPSPPVRRYAIALINRAAAQAYLPAIEELATAPTALPPWAAPPPKKPWPITTCARMVSCATAPSPGNCSNRPLPEATGRQAVNCLPCTAAANASKKARCKQKSGRKKPATPICAPPTDKENDSSPARTPDRP